MIMLRKIVDNYCEMISSIGFYLFMLFVVFLIFVLIIIVVEYFDLVMSVKKVLSVLLVDSEENVCIILSILVGSIIFVNCI